MVVVFSVFFVNSLDLRARRDAGGLGPLLGQGFRFTGGLGLFFGVVGLFIGIARKERGIGYSIAGTAISAISLMLGLALAGFDLMHEANRRSASRQNNARRKTKQKESIAAQAEAEKKEKAEVKAEREAEVNAELFVKQSLKYPDDAEFPWTGQHAVPTEPIDGQRYWVVIGKVKATNGFGHKLTHNYRVDLYRKAGEWKLRDVTLDPK